MNQDAADVGLGLGFVLIYCVLILIVIVAMWKVFEKAGKPGWHSIVPILNLYQMVMIAGRPGWWLLLFLIPFVNIIPAIVVSIDIARRFGRGTGFGLGLAFLPFIFYAVLAFSAATYDGGVAPAAPLTQG